MLDLITMTPWEHRGKYVQHHKNGSRINNTVESIFEQYVAKDVWDLGNGDPLVGELAVKPVYAGYIARYRGSDLDDSPLRIGEKGYTLECDSYVSSIYTMNHYMKTGLCILCAANYGIKVYADKDDLDKITIEFLAKREEAYTVYLNLFSEYISCDWSELDKSLYDRITIDGKRLTKENYFDLVGSSDERTLQMYPEYVLQSKKEYYRQNRSSDHAPYRFDAVVTFPARNFIMNVERGEMAGFHKGGGERAGSGKYAELFPGYEVVVHTQNLKKEFVAKYPVVFAVRKFEDGSMECGQLHLVKYPTLLEMLNDMYNDANGKGCSRVMYAVWDKPSFREDDPYKMDLFEDVEVYVEIDAENKRLHLYDKGYFGRKKFFGFYRDDAKFISGG